MSVIAETRRPTSQLIVFRSEKTNEDNQFESILTRRESIRLEFHSFNKSSSVDFRRIDPATKDELEHLIVVKQDARVSSISLVFFRQVSTFVVVVDRLSVNIKQQSS